MRRLALVLTGLSLLAVAGCHKAPPGKPGRGLALPDVSKVKPVDGTRIDPKVIRVRMLAGRWSAPVADGVVTATFGASSLSMEVDRRFDGALVAAASGPFSFSDDGTLHGTTSGATGALAPFSSWSASFPSTGRMTMIGVDDARLEFVKAVSMPPRVPGSFHPPVARSPQAGAK